MRLSSTWFRVAGRLERKAWGWAGKFSRSGPFASDNPLFIKGGLGSVPGRFFRVTGTCQESQTSALNRPQQPLEALSSSLRQHVSLKTRALSHKRSITPAALHIQTRKLHPTPGEAKLEHLLPPPVLDAIKAWRLGASLQDQGILDRTLKSDPNWSSCRVVHIYTLNEAKHPL